MATSNRIVKVALVGAGGHVGRHIAEALLQTGKHQVTAITRTGSTSTSTSSLPDGITVAKVDYNDPSSLVAALQGHDALVITISVTAQAEQEKLIRAAADAEVPWILPNEWGFDSASDSAMVADLGMAERVAAPRDLIAALGKSSWIAVSTGFWYEWSLSFADAFGFDLPNKRLTLFDDGAARVTVCSWPQVGRAVAGLLSLNVNPESGDVVRQEQVSEPHLAQFRNSFVYPASFCVSQNEALASVLRVTRTTADEWTVTRESTRERFDTAMHALRTGNPASFVKAMYTRAFFPDEPANVDRWRGGNHNAILGLRGEEDRMDEYTQVAIDRVPEMTAWLKSVHG
ncbi:hypothetical protein PV04_07290 [Phialophora macrospora]|uniref:NmrA-like domain-containing protein n=1 Tax=Phialophora macrospora TaxID=1851006 RepID=A0A0D2FAK2_9EURO|nr:hypothetical protein PV04_07290 [Phialophora macrospora]